MSTAGWFLVAQKGSPGFVTAGLGPPKNGIATALLQGLSPMSFAGTVSFCGGNLTTGLADTAADTTRDMPLCGLEVA